MFTRARRNKCYQPGTELGQKQKNYESNYQITVCQKSPRADVTSLPKKEKKDEFDFSQFVRSVEKQPADSVATLRL